MENNTIIPVVVEADLIEQQKQARLEKARETRRKNNLEKKVITKALTDVAKQKVKMYDPESKKIIYKTKAELLSEKILEDALSDEISAKDRQEAFKLIRDTMGEKPTERVEAQVGLTLEQLVQRVNGDSDY